LTRAAPDALQRSSRACAAAGVRLGEKSCHRHAFFADHFVVGGQRLSRVASGVAAKVFGGGGRHDLSSLVAAFGTEVDHPVGGGNHVEVMFDHQHGLTVEHQTTEDFQKLADVVEVKPRGGFVKYVEMPFGGVARFSFSENLRKLQALRFAAREGGKRLTEFDVIETDINETLKRAFD